MNKFIQTKRVVIALVICALTFSASARRHYHHHHHHRHDRVGLAVGAGLLGAGLLASTIYNATRPDTVVVAPQQVVVQQPAPVVVQQPAPVVVQQPAPVVIQQTGHYETRVRNVWVEGRYVDQVTPTGVVRTWQPGHYEQVSEQVWVP